MEGDNTTKEGTQYQPKTDQNQHLIDELRMGKSKISFAKSPTKKSRRSLGTKKHPFSGQIKPKKRCKKVHKNTPFEANNTNTATSYKLDAYRPRSRLY